MERHHKITVAVVSGAVLFLFVVGSVGFTAYALWGFLLRGPKDPAKAERLLAQEFEQKPDVFERLASIAGEDRKHFEDSITIKRRGTIESDLSSERVAEYRSLLSHLGAKRIALTSKAELLSIKIDLHSWGYADSYQVIGWYFLDPYDKDRLYPEPHRVDSIAEPYRHPKDHPTTSLQPAKGAWWYFLEHGD